MKDYSRILPGQPIDDGRNEARRDCDRASDPQFPRRRIGEEFDVLHGLLQLIEGDKAAIEKCARIDRRLRPPRVTIEQTHAECVLHIGNCL